MYTYNVSLYRYIKGFVPNNALIQVLKLVFLLSVISTKYTPTSFRH